MSWILIISIFTALAVGFALGRLSFQQAQRSVTQDVELHNTKTEFDRYKTEVSEHLRETSELMHAAESNYQQLSEQLKRTKLLLANAQDTDLTLATDPAGSTSELPPKDYSGTASGLLKEKKAS